MAVDKNTPESSRMANNYLTFIRQMKSESDRGAAIVSVSLLDDILNGLLKSKLAPSLEKKDELFDATFSPFSSFSAKIDLAYRMGLFCPSVRSSLHLLRKIRNDFAHASEINGFDDPSTQSRIRELIKLNKYLLNAITDDLKTDSDIDINLEKTSDLVEELGWRHTLQVIFALLAAGMSEIAFGLESIEAIPDSTSETPEK